MRAQSGADGPHQRAAEAGSPIEAQLADEIEQVFSKAAEKRLQAASDDSAQPQGPMRFANHFQPGIAIAQPRQQGTDECDVGRAAATPC